MEEIKNIQEIISYYDKCAKEWNIDGIGEERLEINTFILFDILRNVKTILDIGCGGGALAEYYAKKRFMVTGIDISSKMIENAKNKHSKNGNPRFFCGDIMNYTLDKKFDLVMANGSIEHMNTHNEKLIIRTFAKYVNKYLYLDFPHPEYRKTHHHEDQVIDREVDIISLKEALAENNIKIIKNIGYGRNWGNYYTMNAILGIKK